MHSTDLLGKQSLLNKPGKTEIRRVVLEEIKSEKQPEKNLNRNPGFFKNSAGNIVNRAVIANKIKPDRNVCQFADGKATLSLESEEKQIALVQHKLSLVPGTK